jgi:hypothetical protein
MKIVSATAVLGCAAVLTAAAPATDPAEAPKEEVPAGQTCSTPSLRIEIAEQGKPAATVSIPLWMIKGASKLVAASGKPLGDKVDFDRLVELAADPNARGVLIDIEDHRSKDRVVISVCREPAPAQK